MSVTWDDEVEAVFAGDLTAGLGYRTPAGGVVVQAVAPIALHDRDNGTLGFTTSLGFSKKLERIALDPRIAMAFHSREHGSATGTLYVLAQGTARVIEHPSEEERARVRANATVQLGPPKEGYFWDRWMREYYYTRVPVEVTVTRLLVWPTLDAGGAPQVLAGGPLEHPAPQSPPKNGTGPRIDAGRTVKRLLATDHHLLGYAGADGAPVVLPVMVGGAGEDGIELHTAADLPPGGRRAGLTGHSYHPQLVGLETRQHTGWLEVDESGRAVYAPHTATGYKAPANKLLVPLIAGAVAKRGVRKSR